jgi:hypothetical protein
MYIRALGDAATALREMVELLMVVLVIAEHVYDWAIDKALLRPPNARDPYIYITGQNDQVFAKVTLELGDIAPEFQVQVAKDSNFHAHATCLQPRA